MRFNVPIVIATVGFCILIIGFFCANFIFPKLEIYLIEKETSLVEGGKTFESWKKIPFPFKFKIYFFNVINPDEVQMGSKPVLREMGPYIYDEYRQREVIFIDDENDTIKYKQRKTYFFNKEESGCRSEDDIVTIINFAVVSTVQKINKISPMALPMVNDALPYLYPGIKNIFITNSVRNILFEGLRLSCESDEVDMICEGLREKRPHTIREAENGRDFLLSLFHHINNTEDGPYEIGRGLKNRIKGEIISFKDENKFSAWSSDPCNTIKGTDLTINPNLWEIPKKIEFLAPDFCRYFLAYFDKERTYQGLGTYVFKSNGLFQKDDDCFCGESCGPKGTMDVRPCSGSYVVLSQPHFLNAEKSLFKFCQGLQPDRDKHGTYIIMEPKTGLALLVKSRFQMNVFLQKFDDVAILQNVSEGFFPFLWLENGAKVPNIILDEIRKNFDKLNILNILKYVMIISGVLMMVASIIMAMVKDKILCNCGRSNAISIDSNWPIRKFVNMYDANNKPVWKITE